MPRTQLEYKQYIQLEYEGYSIVAYLDTVTYIHESYKSYMPIVLEFSSI